MSKMSNILKITLAYQVLTNMYVLSLSLIFQTLLSMGQNCSKGSKGEASPSKEMVSFSNTNTKFKYQMYNIFELKL